MASSRAVSEDRLTPEQARSLFPGLEHTVYFATHGQALLPRPTRERLVSAIDALVDRGVLGGGSLERGVESVRKQVAALLGADPREIAFVRNTGEALCLIAEQIDWRPGDEVLAFAGEYRSVVHAFQGMAHRGVRVRVAAPAPGRRVTPQRVAEELRERTRVLALSWVRYDNGARADLVGIGRVLAEAGVLFVVDAIQGLGALPLDVRAAGIDFLAAGAHKWLLGVAGTGILYLRRERLGELLPIHLGVGSMEDAARVHTIDEPYPVNPIAAARRVEEGARNLLGILALGESLSLSARIGIDAIAEQVHRITERLCEGIRARGGRVRSPRGEGEWSGIVLLEPPPGLDAQRLGLDLLRQGIVIGAREGALWAGAHFYNDEGDVERLLAAIDRAARS